MIEFFGITLQNFCLNTIQKPFLHKKHFNFFHTQKLTKCLIFAFMQHYIGLLFMKLKIYWVLYASLCFLYVFFTFSFIFYVSLRFLLFFIFFTFPFILYILYCESLRIIACGLHFERNFIFSLILGPKKWVLFYCFVFLHCNIIWGLKCPSGVINFVILCGDYCFHHHHVKDASM